ncbi:MAG: exonuclease SbcCD subunit D [Negativicutes bacterium]|nr:exonuclease SbcCD subunit D [Negativicutes bacterium]
MKLLHLADLHLGKRVNEFDLIEDQRNILQQILQIIEREQPEVILIAGDLYDKSQPSIDAVELMDEFLTTLIMLDRQVFLISGNHDSPERLGFGSRILQKNHLTIAGVFNGRLDHYVLTDEYGPLNLYLLPYLKPALVRPYFESKIETYDDAVRAVLTASQIDPQERNLLLAHQFVTGGMQAPQRSDSESVAVGGLDQIGAELFAGFDYVALGHLHGPQQILRESIRYAGSPLKYSFSEARQRKSVTLLELRQKGSLVMRSVMLQPLHDMREIRGPLSELLKIGQSEGPAAQDYLHVTLTDEDELYDAVGQLRRVYPNLMMLDFDNCRTRGTAAAAASNAANVNLKNPLSLFAEFYQLQNNQTLTTEQLQLMEKIFRQAGGESV